MATVRPATGCVRASSRAVEALRGPGWATRSTHRPAPCGPPVRRATRASPRPGSAAIHGWWASASLVRTIGSTPRSASAVPRRTAEGPWRPTAVPRRRHRLVADRRTGDRARRLTAVVRRPLAADRRRIATDPRRIVAIPLGTAASRPTDRPGARTARAVRRPADRGSPPAQDRRPGLGPGSRSRHQTCSVPTRSSSPVAARSRRSSPPAGPRSGCWSCPNDATPSNSSSSTPRGCASRSSRSKAGR